MTNCNEFKAVLGGNVHAKVDGNSVYYQIQWFSGVLACKYSKNGVDWTDFSGNATYHDTFAQCSEWPKGYPT